MKVKVLPKSCCDCEYQHKIIEKDPRGMNYDWRWYKCKLNRKIQDTHCVVSRASKCPLKLK